MRTHRIPTALFAGLLLLGVVVPATAQTGNQEADDHHPTETQTAPAPASPDKAPAVAAPGGMPGMGMMTPEMMQMMQRMMSQGGMPGMMGTTGSGVAGQGRTPMAGTMMCPMMQMMMAGRAEMGTPEMMGAPAMLYGMMHDAPEEMTEDRVQALLEQHLTQLGNPRLELGQVGSATDGSVTAEIVTVDGSLVQKLAFNRFPGLVRQIEE